MEASQDECAWILLEDSDEELNTEVVNTLFGSESITHMHPNEAHNFLKSRKSEIDGLLQRVTFTIVTKIPSVKAPGYTVPDELTVSKI